MDLTPPVEAEHEEEDEMATASPMVMSERIMFAPMWLILGGVLLVSILVVVFLVRGRTS